ncbi:hypothetical protein A3B85_02500 [Candidatus Nomurabacteria bacterium RIFCSPHIGHO2_02_FULL_37_13]|uniref:Sugar ABC transporter substrate-binding protein n=1 Tax=Candidatus Nomurabacteria bacterium RIFCSPHIGHO2_02_FULL_37_13 TaxID=1801750 RepID=A0A1F6W4D2_9BACT|nr:MAG: hypothetical protein A2640_00340 [Candidatus Nomurabacteria bacterium RIFCSPHIGHO2_01_FULL_36_23]OGI76769.1 MAG: hypothetical protein A3B85_02500 [Candidatus Nomurabacteria bacterium RIFCSPHIGHO2_02_FULL_37_13]OGI88498.1 MAG: hypothetical protein A2906_00100 [Candidatus Nomurabacteria bacterium RIFCSPLOWO2_01_FULL_37_25]
MKGNFQLITIIVFIAAAILGVLVFSGAIPIGNQNATGGQGTVVLWGTVKSGAMLSLLEDFNNANPTFIVKYEEKSPDTFDQDLLEAIASGVGPDMFFLPDNLAFRYSNKIVTIPFASYSLATFKNTFASAGEVFLSSKGILAFPISIDPLVMYYNRSMLDANAVIFPPAFWDEFTNLVPFITKKDDSNKIIKSAAALGHFSNIAHAKDIISAFFMQAGNPIVSEKDGAFSSILSSFNSQYDLASVLKFYTDFADPSKNIYSWNRSMPNSVDAFSAENLAFYFGHASELATLINKNPNQNFFVAPIPQIKDAKFKLTGARVTGLAISSFSKNFNTAFVAASLMATGDFANKFAMTLGVAPARRDLLKIMPVDSYSPIFYNSALFAKSWLDPSNKDTDDIFRRMIDGVLSNSVSTRDAISDADAKLNLLLVK